jgi:receptor expression-enhancing protein 5/6
VIKLTDDTTNLLYDWIPMYSVVKLAIIIWLLYPTTRGAEKIYDKLISPVFRKYESKLEATFDRLWASVDSATEKL